MGQRTVGPRGQPGAKPGVDGWRPPSAVRLPFVLLPLPEGRAIPAPDLGPFRLYEPDGREVKPGEPLLPGRRYILATADVTAIS